jgi:hypothetical protein
MEEEEEDLISSPKQILPIPITSFISDSVKIINTYNSVLYTAATGIENSFYQNTNVIVDYFNENAKLLFNSVKNFELNANKWQDFLTTVYSNSARWLKPMTVFYPKLIREPFTDENLLEILNWIKKFYPIRTTQDGSLNYVENQKFIVSCYLYDYSQNINILDQPYAYTKCVTQSGLISLHCQTLITGGWIHCHQGSYNCNRTINCYPSLNVDCWYETPYLKIDGSPINTNDPVSVKQVVRSQIQSNLIMNYIDRRETKIKTLIFKVENCDWVYSQEGI